MDPLHRQAVLDCYDDIARDMDPGLVLRYSTVRWRDGDPGFIRAKARAEGPHFGARALLDRLTGLPSDGFDDFVQSLKEVPYDHLVEQLLKTRERLKDAVKRGEIRRPQDVPQWKTNIMLWALGILMTICVCMYMVLCGSRIHEPTVLAVFPRRLKTFVGREDVFSRIDTCLQENQTCLIKGLGGVGKTSVAIEYGHRRAERYPGGVYWVRLASKQDMCASISQYGLFLIEKEKETVHCNKDQSCESVTCLFKIYLTKSQYWLLIVDEAGRDTMEELESLLPRAFKTTMHVVLSSRERLRLDKNFIPEVHLPPFSETEAQAMFNKTVRPSTEEDRGEIVRLSRSLGHHPLALQLAFAYITATGCSAKDYHQKYIGSSRRLAWLDESDIGQVTSRRIVQTLDPHIYTLEQWSPKTATLLNMTSFMGPECIPCPQPNSPSFGKLFTVSGQLDKLDTLEMVAMLVRFSLATPCSAFQPCAFSVNRLVQEAVVEQMNESLKLVHLGKALEYSKLLLKHGNVTTRVQAELLMAHVHYLVLNIGRYQLNVTGSSTFLNISAEFFCQWGACDEAYYLH